MISLEEFREDYINEINLTAVENSEHQPDAFIDEMSDTLIEDFSIINGLDKCFYSFNKGTKAFKNMQIDGGYLDLPANVVDLLIADYNAEEITTITNEFINSKSQLMINYFENVLKGYFANAEDSNEAVQLAYSILNNIDSINKIHLVIISTNKLSTRVKTIDFPDFVYNNRKFKVELDVIDIQMIYNSRLKDFKKEPVVINTKDFGFKGIQCIKADIGTSDYEAYLAIVPCKFLCDIYEKYGPRLLESNVRSFLNAKGAVNKGIRGTILNERNKFFTYNNGISTVAKNIKTEMIHNEGLYITEFNDFQIINGGQTTASLASADIKDKAPLDNIYVQMKLTIVKEDDPEFVHNISKYANSQNKVTAADLNSNHPFYVKMEEFSRKTYAPPVNNQPYQTLWFFERARGQYDQPKMSMSKAEREKYTKLNPKNQKFTKTDLAKYLNSAAMKPYAVSKGAQLNLVDFQTDLEAQWNKDKLMFNELFYKDLISKAILFKTIEKVISDQDWYIENKAYRAQLVTYSFSKLIYEVKKNGNMELDYKTIWDKQSVPQYLIDEIIKISKLCFDAFNDPNRTFNNIGEYTKRKDCWTTIKDKNYTLSEDTIESLISKEEKKIEAISAKKDEKLNNSVMQEVEIFQLGTDYWNRVKKLGLEQGIINGKDVEFIDFAIKYCNGLVMGMSPAQTKIIFEIKQKLEENGIK